jgi:acyl carrier protein
MNPTLSDFIDVMSEAFSPNAQVEAGVRFREMEEWSSMQALIVIAAVDEHFEITLPEKDFRKAETFEDLYQLTISLKENV